MPNPNFREVTRTDQAALDDESNALGKKEKKKKKKCTPTLPASRTETSRRFVQSRRLCEIR
jgi:hypothetical protein